jgi:hypothetical protein
MGPRSGLVGVWRRGSPLQSKGIEHWVAKHFAKVYTDFDVSVLAIINNNDIYAAEYHITWSKLAIRLHSRGAAHYLPTAPVS